MNWHHSRVRATIVVVAAVIAGTLGVASPAWADSAIQGRVLNQDSQSIANVVVEALGTGLTTTSDGNGFFSLPVDSGIFDVRLTPPASTGLQAHTVGGVDSTGNSIIVS